MSQRRSFSFFRKKKEEVPQAPQPIPTNLAMRIIEKELELEKSWEFKVIHELISLYTKMIEHYEQNNNPKYYDFQDRMHKMLIKPQVIAALQKVNCPKTDEKHKLPNHSESNQKTSDLKTDLKVKIEEKIGEKVEKFGEMAEKIEEKVENFEEKIEIVEQKAVHIDKNVLKPEECCEEKENKSEEKEAKNFSLVKRKEQAELTRKVLAIELTRTLKRSKTNRNVNIIIERQNTTSKDTSHRALADFKSQDSVLERRLASRKLFQLTRSMTLNSYNSPDQVFPCDLSYLDEENTSSTKSSFFTIDEQSEGLENFEKKLEEIMEKNFSERSMQIAETKFRYENQMKDIIGMGDLQDMLIKQMRVNMQEEIDSITQEFNNKRKEEVQRLKFELVS